MAEMAFAYDYLCPLSKNELLGKGIKKYDSKDYEFTKEDTELYNKIVQGRMFNDCFDIRDNTSNYRITELNDGDFNKFFEDLPKDTHFCVLNTLVGIHESKYSTKKSRIPRKLKKCIQESYKKIIENEKNKMDCGSKK